MKKIIVIAAVALGAAITARGQTPDPLAELLKPPPIDPTLTNLPSFKPDGPIHEIPRGLLPQSTEPSVITKSNRRLWSADFKIEVQNVSPVVSNLSVNVVLERKYKLEHLQSVHLLVGQPSEKNEVMATVGAKLFVPLWRRYMFEEHQTEDAPVYSSFVLTRDLAKEAFLRLECFSRRSGTPGSSMFFKGPASVYLIDLSSFVPPPPPPPKPAEESEDGDDTININISI